MCSADDDRDEAEFVATQVLHLLHRGDISSFADVGLVFRTNLQSRVFEEALSRRRIPHRVVGAMRFYERKEVKDVVAYLRLLYNEHDAASMERILNVPPRGIGPQTRNRIQAHALARNCSLMDALLDLSHTAEVPGAALASVGTANVGEEADAEAADGSAIESLEGTARTGKGGKGAGILSRRKREALAQLHRVLQELQALVAVCTPAELMEEVSGVDCIQHQLVCQSTPDRPRPRCACSRLCQDHFAKAACLMTLLVTLLCGFSRN